MAARRLVSSRLDEGCNPSAERRDQLRLGEHDEGVRTRAGHRRKGVV
jgi:hypothetical protein